MSEWKTYKLSDIASLSNGINFDKSAYTRGIKLIGVVDFKDRIYPDYDTLQEVDTKVVRCSDLLKKGDIVFVRSNGNKELVGRCMMINKDIPVTFSGFCIKLSLNDKEKFDPLFFNYLFKTDQFRRKMSGTAVGANIQNLSQSRLGGCEVSVPEKEVQHRIATILSRYDTLIENYQKQIKLLEEAAQRLYKEWFVDLRFPGYENAKMVDGLPEGWERKKLIEFDCSLESGARPKGGVDSNLKDGIPSVGAENVIGLGKYNYSSEKLVTNQFYSQMRKGKIKDRDILIYKDGAYIGRTSLFQDGFPHKEMAVNEHVFLLHTLNENYQYYVFFTLYQKQYFEKMQKLNKNAAQPGLNQKALLDLVMLCPTENFVLSFNKAIEPLMKALFSKANQIRLLTEARDRLLPRLMGGEMEVDAPKGQRATSIEQRSGHNEQTTNAPKGQKH